MKSIRKTAVIILSIVMVLALLGGCKNGKGPSGDAEDDTVFDIVIGEEIEEIDEPEARTEVSAGELPDDLYSFTIMLDGDVYELPAPFAEFEANGWGFADQLAFDDPDEVDLEPDMYTTTIVLENGGHLIYVDFVNNDMDTKKMRECYIGGISLTERDAKGGTELVFPGGIKHGSSEKDIVSLYGEPSDLYDGDVIRVFSYNLESYSMAKVTCDSKTGLVTELRMQNLERKEKSADAGGEAPDVVKAYKAPSSLGDSWESGTAKYGGKIYQLPVPVSVFMEDGWIPVSDENIMIKAKDSARGFEIRNGNQVLRTNLHNYSDSQQPAKFCFITLIEYSGYGPSVSLELPGGLSEKSSIDDFIKEYGKPDSTNETSSMETYEWGDYSKSVYIIVDKETGAISKIKYEFNPKTLD